MILLVSYDEEGHPSKLRQIALLPQSVLWPLAFE